MRRHLRFRRVFLYYLVGTLALQVSWILAVPAFKGIDEFDHVFKATAVARGVWLDEGTTPDARGGVVIAPRDVVEAASTVCQSYEYTEHGNCFPIGDRDNGMVTVASGASTYNPTYYAVVGILSRPFHGVAVDYVIRLTTALICALLIAWAGAITGRRWGTKGLAILTLGNTPVLMYSTAMAAPNGITYSASALMWVALLAHRGTAPEARPVLVLATAVGAIGMVTTHTTGMMWLVLGASVVVYLDGIRSWIRRFQSNSVIWTAAALVVVVTCGLSLAWIIHANTNAVGEPPAGKLDFPFVDLPAFELLWLLQGIAAFPIRDDHAPIPVYVLWGLPLLAVFLNAWRRGNRRERIALGVITLLIIAVPFCLSYLSFSQIGWAWQGRYSLPLLLVLTATSLRVLADPNTSSKLPLPLLYVALAIAASLSTVNIVINPDLRGPTEPLASVFTGGIVLVIVLPLAAYALFWAASRTSKSASVTTRHAGSDNNPKEAVT